MRYNRYTRWINNRKQTRRPLEPMDRVLIYLLGAALIVKAWELSLPNAMLP